MTYIHTHTSALSLSLSLSLCKEVEEYEKDREKAAAHPLLACDDVNVSGDNVNVMKGKYNSIRSRLGG
jgi:hypothetical protein